MYQGVSVRDKPPLLGNWLSNHINGDCFLDEKHFSVFTIYLKKPRGFITQDQEMWKGQKKKKINHFKCFK